MAPAFPAPPPIPPRRRLDGSDWAVVAAMVALLAFTALIAFYFLAR